MHDAAWVSAKPSIPMTRDAFCKKDCTAITWLTGGGFLINARGTIVMIDPVITYDPCDDTLCETGAPMAVRLPVTSAQVPFVDAVFYTHADSDHCGPLSAPALALKTNGKLYGPAPVYKSLIEMDIDWRHVEMCRAGDSISLNDLTIHPVNADHPHQFYDMYQTGRCEKVFRKGDCCGYIIKCIDGTLYFPGDTRLMEEHFTIAKLVDVDVLALDVSVCHYHLSREGAIVMGNIFDKAYLLPCHYGSYREERIPGYVGNPANVIPYIHDGEMRASVLAPGEPFCIREGKRV